MIMSPVRPLRSAGSARAAGCGETLTSVQHNNRASTGCRAKSAPMEAAPTRCSPRRSPLSPPAPQLKMMDNIRYPPKCPVINFAEFAGWQPARASSPGRPAARSAGAHPDLSRQPFPRIALYPCPAPVRANRHSCPSRPRDQPSPGPQAEPGAELSADRADACRWGVNHTVSSADLTGNRGPRGARVPAAPTGPRARAAGASHGCRAAPEQPRSMSWASPLRAWQRPRNVNDRRCAADGV